MAQQRHLELGVYLPVWADGTDRLAPWNEVREVALAAAAAGFDTLWMPDHFAPMMPDGSQQLLWECWTMLAALAEATTDVGIGSLITPTAFRPPALLAKMAATVDGISGGRLILGLGTGSARERGFELLDADLEHRASIFAEALEVVVPLLREGSVDFGGAHYQVHDYHLGVPRRSSGPPIWIAGIGPRVIRLAARWADAFNLNRMAFRPEDVIEPFARFDEACRACGRDPADVLHTAYTGITLDSPRSGDDTRAHWIYGAPAAIALQLHALSTAGVRHLTCFFDAGEDPMGKAGLPLVSLRALERFAPVIAALRALERSGDLSANAHSRR